ncbi:MAG TPA: RdgB/HAM1 family non-canonical purine NTP pyrophosphatase [Solirubrobacterales bacterium]
MILATSNLHKVGEMRDLLPGIDLEPLPAGYESPVEDGDSFEANALIKARAAHAAFGGAVLADDSGIEAFDLGGAPGIHSARYAGEGASDEDNLDKLLREVDAAGGERRAAYVCAIALLDEDGTEHVFEATCEGVLLRERRGSGGFGYDPIFVPDDTDDERTMSELSADEKNAISHRGRAARLLAAHLGR